ncbi:helix-turn-helix transcriptional regulator [Hansschlegelia sp.]|uniref:helix-turn-helix transcriptional regulator n=1 Tax=Hansschlegelia sp. TaxID=2041892 RepID=UPI002BF2B08C|nr:helix-turn-helix transcriptional regulator [Hansschlegelia sp.]HVI27499.1 helix-turn-helix transcriptional regulator [Hansschlegelia sp.]
MTLAQYLAEHRLSHAAFAVMIGTSQAAVSRYALHRRMPRREHLQKIIEATGGAVTPNDFMKPAEAAAAAQPEAAA